MPSELSCEHKKVISDAYGFATSERESQEKFVAEFKKKWFFGLWWDAKGFWNSSDKDNVMASMGIYSKLYEDVVTCTDEIVRKEDGTGYQSLLDLYKKIEEIERDAEIDAMGKSKAVCRAAKSFLDNHWQLEHKLKRVECILLEQDIKEAKEEIKNLKEELNNTKNYINEFREDNQYLKKSVYELKEENLDFKKTVRSLRKENQDLKDLMSELNATTDLRIREMMEENRRTMQRMIIEMKEKKIEEKNKKEEEKE